MRTQFLARLLVWFLVVAPVCAVLQGCKGLEGVEDVSGRRPYSEQIGRQFRLLKDCYVYTSKDRGTNLYVGNAMVGGVPPGGG